jgi:hypothetical protein
MTPPTSNVLFGWPIYSDVGVLYTPTFAGGAWDANFPLTNLATRYLDGSSVARSSSAALKDTRFKADLKADRAIRVVAIPKHTLSSAAYVRVLGAPASMLFDYEAGDDASSIAGYSFTRATAATYVDRNGVLRSAASGELRDSHFIGGLRHTLLEVARHQSLYPLGGLQQLGQRRRHGRDQPDRRARWCDHCGQSVARLLGERRSHPDLHVHRQRDEGRLALRESRHRDAVADRAVRRYGGRLPPSRADHMDGRRARRSRPSPVAAPCSRSRLSARPGGTESPSPRPPSSRQTPTASISTRPQTAPARSTSTPGAGRPRTRRITAATSRRPGPRWPAMPTCCRSTTRRCRRT